MRNLLSCLCALDLPEPAVYGLGSGFDTLFIEGPGISPQPLVFGRSISMERDVADAMGIDYREHVDPDNHSAWKAVRQEICENRPVMLSGDVYYLDYREHKVHFPAHRFVLLGFDDSKEIAYVADRSHGEPQACSYRGLRLSRNPPEGISTYNLWGKFHDTNPKRSIEEACRTAIRRTVARNMEQDDSQSQIIRSMAPNIEVTSGLLGIERFARTFEQGPRQSRGDLAFWAYYTARCIEDFGTGGGQFRLMFATFLEWVRERIPQSVESKAVDQASASGAQWTQLSQALDELSKMPEETAHWSRCYQITQEILCLEQQLVETLASFANSD